MCFHVITRSDTSEQTCPSSITLCCEHPGALCIIYTLPALQPYCNCVDVYVLHMNCLVSGAGCDNGAFLSDKTSVSVAYHHLADEMPVMEAAGALRLWNGGFIFAFQH